MARKSYAFGTATLHTKDIIVVDRIFEILNRHLKDIEYSTFFYDYENSATEKESKEWYSTDALFIGRGDWNYSCNIRKIGDLCNHDPFLTALEWKIDFKFADEEGERDFLYVASTTLAHESGEELEDMRPSCTSYTRYARTPYTLYNFLNYSLDEIEAMFGMDEKSCAKLTEKELRLKKEELLNASIRSCFETKDEPMTRYQAEQIVLWDLPFLDLEK